MNRRSLKYSLAKVFRSQGKILFCYLLLSLSAFSIAVPRLTRNGFVSASGLAPKSSSIATGWTMGFPISGVSKASLDLIDSVKLYAGYWSKLALANPPPAPSISTPTVVLSDETGEYDSYDETLLQITGQKTPIVHYQFDSLVIAYTNDVELPLAAINQVSDQSVWSLGLPLNEGDVIELSLISSNMFGLSTSRTVMLITQIPEPVLLLFPLALLFFFRKRCLNKKIIASSLLIIICAGASQSYAADLNNDKALNNIIENYENNLLLASPPPAPSISAPKVVLSDETSEYDSYDESLLPISGQKTPIVNYQFNSLVIAFTNDVELPSTAINQVPDQSLWSMELPLSEGDVIKLSLISSNIFGLSASRTVILITQIPEPVLLMLPFILLFLFRKHVLNKKIIAFSLFFIICAASTQSRAAEFNYQGVVEIEGGAYVGDGYFKFVIGNENQTTNYWSNDGTSTGEPSEYVFLNVENGFFSLPLGGSGMTSIPRTLFSDESNLYLSVWFNFKPSGTYLRLGPAQRILSVPMALNADMVDGYNYNEIIANTATSIYNSGYANLTTISNIFLLKSGDVCTGKLQVSNLVSKSNVELPDDGRVYLNSAKDAYISSGASGNVTIFKNDKPIFEIE